jgi:wyosine [tRNA(Phe)-imidazoG37] synthetase (radical SAM superfamily)
MPSLTFGPVPSRRLGHSLGINNIPPKTCSYSCVYCQVGRTTAMCLDRGTFYPPEEIVRSVGIKVEQLKEKNEPVDYLTFVADGEPSLDVNIGREIELLRTYGIKIAVITNASLFWREDVRSDLRKADWVSVKIDTVNEKVWRRINRPHKLLRLDKILDGVLEFRKIYHGLLATETMLMREFNDNEQEFDKIADYLHRLQPDRSYLAVPTRPPAVSHVHAAGEGTLNKAYQIFTENLDGVEVEYLIGYEGNAFACTGNVEDDLLSITSVHPMREDAVKVLLEKAGTDWNTVEALIKKGSIVEIEYEGKKFFMRKLQV